MNILRIAEALTFARTFYFKSLDSSADPSRVKVWPVETQYVDVYVERTLLSVIRAPTIEKS
jgi:hypothetical protein